LAVIAGRPTRGALLPARFSALTDSKAVFFVILITFFLMHLAPGSPWDKAGGRQLSPVVVNNLNIKYGLNKPEYEQFELYLWNVAHFDFGLSYQYEGKR